MKLEIDENAFLQLHFLEESPLSELIWSSQPHKDLDIPYGFFRAIQNDSLPTDLAQPLFCRIVSLLNREKQRDATGFVGAIPVDFEIKEIGRDPNDLVKVGVVHWVHANYVFAKPRTKFLNKLRVEVDEKIQRTAIKGILPLDVDQIRTFKYIPDQAILKLIRTAVAAEADFKALGKAVRTYYDKPRHRSSKPTKNRYSGAKKLAKKLTASDQTRRNYLDSAMSCESAAQSTNDPSIAAALSLLAISWNELHEQVKFGAARLKCCAMEGCGEVMLQLPGQGQGRRRDYCIAHPPKVLRRYRKYR